MRALRAQLEETDNQLEEAERRAKRAVARERQGNAGGGTSSSIIREEEGLFHDLEAARNELSMQKAARRDLETQVQYKYVLSLSLSRSPSVTYVCPGARKNRRKDLIELS